MALLTLFAAGLTRDIHSPWVGFHDWNGAFYSYLARNLLRYPVKVTRLLPVVEIGPIAPTADAAVRYANHPPGIEWLLAGSFTLFGDSESSARLVPILASLLSLWLLLRIVSATHGPAVATLAGLLFAMMPMTTYFGRMVDQEPLCLFFMLTATWGWYAWLGKVPTILPRGACRMIWMVGLIGGILIDWVCVLFAGVMFVDVLYRVFRRQAPVQRLIEAALVPGVTLLGVLLFLVYGGLNGSWTALWDMFVTRTSIADTASQPLRDIASRGGPIQMTLDNVSAGILCLAVYGAIPLFRGRRVVFVAPLVLLSVVGAIWLTVFWPQFLRHNYWQYYLSPFFCAAGACGLLALYDRFAPRCPRWAANITLALLTASLGMALLGTNELFTRRSFSPELIRSWKQLAERLRPEQSVLLVDNPYNTDRRGTYLFRNIVPPHMVYYLDRPVEWLRETDTPDSQAGEGRVLMMTLPPSGRAASILARMPGQFPRYVSHPLLIVDLDPALGRSFGERVR